MSDYPKWAQFGELLPKYITTRYEPDKWLIPFLIPKGFNIFGSEPKTGKTWLSEAIALAISDGFPIGGTFGAWQQGPVIHLSAEDDPEDLKIRAPVVRRHKDLPIENYYISTKAQEFSFEDDMARDKLMDMIEDVQPQLLIFDTARRFFSGDENSSTEVSIMTNFLVKIYTQYGVSSILNHHITNGTRKLRGSTEFYGAAHHVAIIRKTRLQHCEIAMKIQPTHSKAVMLPFEWVLGITETQECGRRFAVVGMDTVNKMKYESRRLQAELPEAQNLLLQEGE